MGDLEFLQDTITCTVFLLCNFMASFTLAIIYGTKLNYLQIWMSNMIATMKLNTRFKFTFLHKFGT